MIGTIGTTEQYNIYDLGFDKFLVRGLTALELADPSAELSLASILGSGFYEISGSSIADGEIDSNLTMIAGLLKSANFVTGVSGWRILYNGDVEFNSGVFRGSLIAGSIHIPDQNSTTNSFHANSVGNTWWGCTETSFNSNPANAAAYILNTGVAKFTNITITGGAISGTTLDIGGADTSSFHCDIDGNIWLGAATYNIATNPFAVSNAGVLRAISGTIANWTLSTTAISTGTFDTLNTMYFGSSGLSLSDVFKVTAAGAITATSGSIAGWTLSATAFSTGAFDTLNTMYFGTSGISLSNVFKVTAAGAITAVSGTIGGWTLATTTLSATGIILDAANQKIQIGATAPITIDGVAKDIESDNYVSGVFGAGFHLDSNLLEVGNIACRGLIRTAVFQKGVVNVMGGSFAVLDGDVLDTDMTALDASTLTTKANTTFVVGDILRIKDGTDDEWLEVTNTASAPIYTITRDKAAAYGANANPAWKKGATIVNYGQSGDGGVYMTSSDTNGPYLSIFDHAGSPYSAITTRLRIGNLNGYLGYVTDLYGIAIGETEKYLKYDITNGLRIKGTIIITNPSDINTNTLTNGAGWTDDTVANTKRRVFVAEPTTPYDIGDLWSDGSILKKCKTQKLTGAYDAANWELATGYTDDTVANSKIKTFLQDAIPTSISSGDFWIDSNDGNKLYRAEIAGADEIKAGEWVAVLTDFANVNGTTKPADNATVGATWGTNLSNIPATLGAPSGSGLFLSSTYMGYYTASAWKTYIDSSGNMILGDIAGGNTGLSWNQGTGALTIKGSVTITAGSVPNNLVSGLGSLALLSVIGNAYITDLNVDKLVAGTISSKAITLAVAGGTGDSYIAAGKTDFNNTVAGFILGIDDSDSDLAKFYIGDANYYLNWTGTDLLVKARYSNLMLYEAVVDAAGYGDYTDIQSAITAGKKRIFVRAGTYTLSADIELVSDTIIQGENKYTTIINLNGDRQIKAVGDTPYTTGTITATNNNAGVTGVDTVWDTNLAAGDYIVIRQDVYKISSITNDTTLVLEDMYMGKTESGLSYRAGTFKNNIILRDFTVKGINTATNNKGQIYFIGVIKSNVENVCSLDGDMSEGVGINLSYSYNNLLSNIETSQISCGIYLYNSDNNIVNNCQLVSSGERNLYLSSSNYNTLSKINASNASMNGIYILNSAYNILENIICNNNSSTGTYGGIYFYGSTNNRLSNIQSNNNNSHGIFFSASSNNNSIINSEMSGNLYSGIITQERTAISNCYIYNNGSYGIWVYADLNTITGNILQSNAGDSQIRLGDSAAIGGNNISVTETVITGNNIYGASTNGIDEINANDDYNLIHGNLIEGVTTAVTLVGANSVDADNIKF